MGINLNLLSYILYLAITLFITFWVGKELHKKGRPLMESAFDKYGFNSWVSSVNNSLLMGYYLLNAGNILLFLTTWEKTENQGQIIEALIENIGFIVTLLGVIHVFNMSTLIFMHFKSNLNKH
ncbi:hypothetical protein [Xanthovirga aplysinae]|uniref:hypothetical protein n=1 Tax=Xanthovirga aplysinae TaxID=2529853 RepID=UPI0012BB93F4|nr:hypothetical protein [Xanthovirga aplysinae]MTI31332.1 hypothetical protein [Xanthovirga aplysinae]